MAVRQYRGDCLEDWGMLRWEQEGPWGTSCPFRVRTVTSKLIFFLGLLGFLFVVLPLLQWLQGEGLEQSWFLVVHNEVWSNGHGGWARGAGSQGETEKAVQSGCCVRWLWAIEEAPQRQGA